FEARSRFIMEFSPLFNDRYASLSESREEVSLNYLSDAAGDDFRQRFYANTDRDLAVQRTTLGVHKDDYEFLMSGMPVKKFGSQGQRKSFIMALKLAQFDSIHREKGLKPILLLDDIFDKLDDHRIESLIDMIRAGSFGQVFITDARPERTAEVLAGVEVNMVGV
ncbi:MAG: DNA replication and repair protein RecF, partial [Leadbetterella sp.]|nr:DNA replication and repair protein RecF [Leadbetterella sp.]